MLATTIASQLQGLASVFRLDVMSKDLVEGRTVIRKNIKKVVTIDLKTRKTLEYTETVGTNVYLCRRYTDPSVAPIRQSQSAT